MRCTRACGVVPDALMALTRLLTTLHDERGNVAVAGLVSGPAPDVVYDEARLRDEGGVLDGVSLIGTARRSSDCGRGPR